MLVVNITYPGFFKKKSNLADTAEGSVYLYLLPTMIFAFVLLSDFVISIYFLLFQLLLISLPPPSFGLVVVFFCFLHLIVVLIVVTLTALPGTVSLKL